MARAQDPTDPIRRKAVTFPAVAKGTSCNQSSFKAGKGSFLFIGPGAKGQGFKAMFKLDRSIPMARELGGQGSGSLRGGVHRLGNDALHYRKAAPQNNLGKVAERILRFDLRRRGQRREETRREVGREIEIH